MMAVKDMRCIAGYWAVGSEIPVSALLDRIRAHDIAICLPYFAKRGSAMTFRVWEPIRELEPSPFGFLQPSQSCEEGFPDALLVPMLGFDRSGNRLGQGGGHYDRYLSRHVNTLRVGVAWSCQEQFDMTMQPWDVPMHAIATEREWIECRMIQDKGD